MTTLAAYETAVPTPITQSAKERYAQAIQSGHAQQDFSAIYQFLNQ